MSTRPLATFVLAAMALAACAGPAAPGGALAGKVVKEPSSGAAAVKVGDCLNDTPAPVSCHDPTSAYRVYAVIPGTDRDAFLADPAQCDAGHHPNPYSQTDELAWQPMPGGGDGLCMAFLLQAQASRLTGP